MAKLYRHFKGGLYTYLGEVIHSESLEKMVLYETRYHNPVGKLWVRPKEMFLEPSRFQEVQFDFSGPMVWTEQIEEQFRQLAPLIFESFDWNKTHQKIIETQDLVLFACFWQERLLAFKLGHRVNNAQFYSWLGGVHPEFRGLGLAYELGVQLVEWCQKQKIKEIKTKTMATNLAMIGLNLKLGFELQELEASKRGTKMVYLKNMAD